MDEGVWKLLDRKQETERDVVESQTAESGGAVATAAESPWLAVAA
ncbi:hypothetical protein [Acidovorax sp. SUPP3334]|nr:hypothetical protein [Acidovorax sp. SUPP3334]GKT24608.1 hypothetical protein AVHM3334_15300 [Acidovorax sp. SUPP3334]